MYLPYYPGDEWVDWVGMSIFHFGQTSDFGPNEVSEPLKFAQKVWAGGRCPPPATRRPPGPRPLAPPCTRCPAPDRPSSRRRTGPLADIHVVHK
jgi:hypothetical protein